MKKAVKVVLIIGTVLFVALIFFPKPETVKISDYLKSNGW